MNHNPTPVPTTAEDAQEVATDLRKLIDSAPAHIWLDLGEGAELPGLTFRDLREVSWSEDNATGVGIKYVRAPVAVATSDAERDAYPALPHPQGEIEQGGGWKQPTQFFTAEQMHAYVDADRKERQLAACNFCLAEAAKARAALPIDFKQATELLAMFGGEPGEVTLLTGEGHSGRGLYAHYSEYPEEGAEFLGVADDEAMPGKQATDQGGWIVAARDVLAERERQVSAEGWTLQHDDAHSGGELALAASCYAAHTGADMVLHARKISIDWDRKLSAAQEFVGRHWPWSREWWKPKDRRSNLVRAGALILAEIERLDRAAAPTLLGVADGDAVGGKSGGEA